MKKILPVLGLIAIATGAQAQTKTGFTKSSTGLEYKMVRDVPGGKTPRLGDIVEVHVLTQVDTSVLFDTRKMNNNEAVTFAIAEPQYKGDIVEGIMLMTPGDSAIFMLSVDTLKKVSNVPDQPWMKPGTGQKIEYRVSLVSVKDPEEMKKAQVAKDEAQLQAYFKQNNIKATKTASGMYYVISQKGTGANAKAGQNVTVNYTGKLMDGTPFDSNTDPQFQHVQPFSFALGQGQVIKGWDEGIALLNKGAKGVLYIPSYLAYGANGQGPIKPNSILIFDVELVDATDAK